MTSDHPDNRRFSEAGRTILGVPVPAGVPGSAVLKAGNLLMSLASTVLLARALGPGGYGVYAFTMAVVMLLALPAGLGMPELVVRETARYRVAAAWSSMRALFRYAGVAVLASSAVLAAAAAFGVLWLTPEHGHATLFVGTALLPLVTLLSLSQAALRGLQFVVLGQLAELVLRPGVFLALVAAVLVAAGDVPGPLSAITLQLLASALALLFAVSLLASRAPRELRSAGAGPAHAGWLRGALPLMLIGSMHVISMYTDIVMLGWLRDEEEVGVYRVAAAGGQLVMFAAIAVNAAVGPLVARLYAAGELRRLQSLVTAAVRGTLLGSVPVAAGLIVLGERLLVGVFGTAYGAGSAALAVLSAGYLIGSVLGSVGLILNMTGHERDTAVAVTVAAGVNVALNGLLIPHWGMVGAAAATALTAVAMALWLAVLVHRRLGLDPSALAMLRTGRDAA